MSGWYENDEFWDLMAPALFGKERWERAADEMDGALELMRLPDGARVLDLCCGPGRHAIELHKRGFVVTAVDRFEKYLAQLREKQPDIETVQADMRAFRREEAFDGVINLFTSFGYFEDDENVQVARNVLDSLKPGGCLLMELSGKEPLSRKFQPRRWHELDDGSILLEKVEVLDNWRRVEATWILLRGDERHTFTSNTRCYSGVELTDLLHEAGFADVTLYGAFDGRPYDENAERLVACARKTLTAGA